MSIKTITPPASEPVTLNQIKEYLRLDGNEHDNILTALITAARTYCEQFQNRSYITQTFELYLDKWQFPIRVPLAPVQSVQFIKYTDSDGNQHTWNGYLVDTVSHPARIVLQSGESVPTVTLQPVNGIVVRYTAGYGDAGDVPESVKLAIKLFVGHRFENPEVEGVPAAVHHLLWPERVVPV